MSKADRESPESVVRALYEVISGAADEARDWSRFQRLFTPSARLRVQFTPAEGPAQTRSWTPEDGWAIESLLWDIEQPHNPIADGHAPAAA